MKLLAPSQRQEWVGTRIMYRLKSKKPILFGLFSRTVFGSVHQGEVVNVTAKSIAFKGDTFTNFFTGNTVSHPPCWVSLDDIKIEDVLPTNAI